MIETFDIAGHTRISVDDELDRDNVSIENSVLRSSLRLETPHSIKSLVSPSLM